MSKYDTKGLKETCLNCGKKSCVLSIVGNEAKLMRIMVVGLNKK